MSIAEKYGAYYYDAGTKQAFGNRDSDLYAYSGYHGSHTVVVEKGDSMLFLSPNKTDVFWVPGGGEHAIESEHFAVVLRGYQCGRKMCGLQQAVNLPYVNGCATRQLFPPERMGDPTFQQLTIPPYTTEQVHHIHPTVRVVYVYSGRGFSIIGQKTNTEERELLPGMTIMLDPMCPHHFRTEDDYLTVLPIHIYSSLPGDMEKNHPMFNGTKEV